jgi:hypothetical protein
MGKLKQALKLLEEEKSRRKEETRRRKEETRLRMEEKRLRMEEKRLRMEETRPLLPLISKGNSASLVDTGFFDRDRHYLC